jgi:putative two-component system response regulator
MAAVPAAASLRLKPWMAGALAPAVAFLYAGATQVAFAHGIVLNLVYPIVTLALSTIFVLRVHYIAERRERMRVAILNEELEEAVRERTQEVRDTQLEVIRRLGRAAEWRDGDTGHHLERMGILCEHLGLQSGLTPRESETLRHAALLHDIGKIGIPDSILLKEGPLDDEEWMVMRGHTTIGAEMLADSRADMVRVAEIVARTHHERWDGTGYPAALAGEKIPIEGRICSICDVFDALLSSRPYKDGWTLDQTLDALRDGAGTQFDPKLVDQFLEIAPEMATRLHPDAVGVRAKK